MAVRPPRVPHAAAPGSLPRVHCPGRDARPRPWSAPSPSLPAQTFISEPPAPPAPSSKKRSWIIRLSRRLWYPMIAPILRNSPIIRANQPSRAAPCPAGSGTAYTPHHRTQQPLRHQKRRAAGPGWPDRSSDPPRARATAEPEARANFPLPWVRPADSRNQLTLPSGGRGAGRDGGYVAFDR